MFTSKTLFWVTSQQFIILMEYNLYQLVRHKILNKIDIKKISKVELFERGAHLVSFGCGEEERWLQNPNRKSLFSGIFPLKFSS